MPDSLSPADSVARDSVSKILADTIASTGLFDDHLLKKVSDEPVPFDHQPEFWIAGILVFCFGLFVYLKTSSGRRLGQIFQAFLRSSSVGQLLREEYALTNRVSVILMLSYFLIFPLFISRILLHFNINMRQETALGLYLVLAATIFVLFFLRMIILSILGFIFEKKETASSYIFTVALFSKNLAIILFPVVLALVYAKNLPADGVVWTGLTVLGIVLIYRLLRTSLLILQGRGISIFYLFVYLCTLEILPFIVLIKVFRMNFL